MLSPWCASPVRLAPNARSGVRGHAEGTHTTNSGRVSRSRFQRNVFARSLVKRCPTKQDTGCSFFVDGLRNPRTEDSPAWVISRIASHTTVVVVSGIRASCFELYLFSSCCECPRHEMSRNTLPVVVGQNAGLADCAARTKHTAKTRSGQEVNWFAVSLVLVRSLWPPRYGLWSMLRTQQYLPLDRPW